MARWPCGIEKGLESCRALLGWTGEDARPSIMSGGRTPNEGLAEDFDHESAGSAEIERPGAVHAGRLRDLVAVLAQTLVDLVDSLLALLDEANMKPCRIFELGAFGHAEQGQYHAVVVGEEAHGFARLRACVTLQAKIFFQKAMGFRNIGDGEIQVVELHVGASALHCGLLLLGFAIRG